MYRLLTGEIMDTRGSSYENEQFKRRGTDCDPSHVIIKGLEDAWQSLEIVIQHSLQHRLLDLCVYIYTILTLNENKSFTTIGRIQSRRL